MSKTTPKCGQIYQIIEENENVSKKIAVEFFDCGGGFWIGHVSPDVNQDFDNQLADVIMKFTDDVIILHSEAMSFFRTDLDLNVIEGCISRHLKSTSFKESVEESIILERPNVITGISAAGMV